MSQAIINGYMGLTNQRADYMPNNLIKNKKLCYKQHYFIVFFAILFVITNALTTKTK